MPASDIYVLHILGLLAARRNKEIPVDSPYLYLDDIVEWLLQRKTSYRFFLLPPESTQVQDALDRLVELGILEEFSGADASPENPAYRLHPWVPIQNAGPGFKLGGSFGDEPPFGGGGDGVTGGGGGGEGDGGGRGLAEVLAHPVLFSVADDDFNELLSRHLGDDGDSGGDGAQEKEQLQQQFWTSGLSFDVLGQ